MNKKTAIFVTIGQLGKDRCIVIYVYMILSIIAWCTVNYST